jgi:hypothetical protein
MDRTGAIFVVGNLGKAIFLDGKQQEVAFTFQIPPALRSRRGMILIILCILRYAGWGATNLILGLREGHFGFDDQEYP